MTVQEITRKPKVKRPQVAIMNAVHDLPCWWRATKASSRTRASTSTS